METLRCRRARARLPLTVVAGAESEWLSPRYPCNSEMDHDLNWLNALLNRDIRFKVRIRSVVYGLYNDTQVCRGSPVRTVPDSPCFIFSGVHAVARADTSRDSTSIRVWWWSHDVVPFDSTSLSLKTESEGFSPLTGKILYEDQHARNSRTTPLSPLSMVKGTKNDQNPKLGIT